jgi:DNA-binding transcriptional LysR family regulator
MKLNCSKFGTTENFQMADLDGMALFIRIMDAGSLSAAARGLGMPKSTVSRRLSQLEHMLGTTLISRSTRAIDLTDAGREFLDRVRPIVREAEQAELEIKSRSARVNGLVRVGATTAFGQSIVAPILCDLMQREPELRIDLRLSDQRENLFEDGIDVAIRMGQLESSELIMRKLCTVTRGLYASKSYLETRNAPRQASDLLDHECIVTSANLERWRFADGSDIRVPWRFASGTVAMALDAATRGQGIALLPRFVSAGAEASGALRRILPDAPLLSADSSALYPRNRTPSFALKAVIDALVQNLAQKVI